MTKATLVEFAEFFDRMKEFSHQSVAKFQIQFNSLIEGFVSIQAKVLDEARLTAPAFNVFSVLGLSRFEVRTHSAMLAQLFNPKGSHGQQFIFLNSFIDLCGRKYPDFPLPFDNIDSGHWNIVVEKIIPEGRIDILIQSPDLGCVFVIENKIDALEQEQQLSRYGLWMDSVVNEYPTQALIFLTIRGDKSISHGDYPYFPLSYRGDITTWLDGVTPDIQAPNVREVVSQYLNLIRHL